MITFYRKIKRLLSDFDEFVRVRRISKYAELSNAHKVLINSYDKEKERELNSLILKALSQEMMEEELPKSYIDGFRSALTMRLGIIQSIIQLNKQQ